MPAIPDFAEEMFDNETGGRHARSSHLTRHGHRTGARDVERQENASALRPARFGRAGMSDPHATLDIVMGRRGCSPVLVGRDAELTALEAALETVRQGEPAAVLIGGEAGMGKSRLIGEFTAAARDAGVRVLTGACLELGADGLPFSPFTAMLRDLVRAEGQNEIAALLSGSGRAARELARLLPELTADRPAGHRDGGRRRDGRRRHRRRRPLPERDDRRRGAGAPFRRLPDPP